MKLSKADIIKLNKKLSRAEELSSGVRVSFNRVHTSKKTYNRKRDRKIVLE